MEKIHIGVIGYGYWGPNLVRNFAEVEGACVSAVCDLRSERLALVRRRYPSIHLTSRANEILTDSHLDAVAIATPVSSHFELVYKALEEGKHVFVEKPLASSSEECGRLIELARVRKRVLMVDHTFIYTSAIRKMKEIIDAGEMGGLYYLDSTRTNLGLFQPDVNVIWDLAPHDLSIILYLLNGMPKTVSTIGASHVNQLVDTAYLNLMFDHNLIAHIHVTWLAPLKIRRIVLSGSQKMLVYDEMEASEKVKVYDKGVTLMQSPQDIYRMLVQYRSGSMYSPSIENSEALQTECHHFVECIVQGKDPLTSGEFGHRVVQLLEAADRSLKRQGAVEHIAV